METESEIIQTAFTSFHLSIPLKIKHYSTILSSEIGTALSGRYVSVDVVALRDEKTRKRELAPFSKVMDELNLKDVKLTVLCEDGSQRLDDGVEVVNVLEWLVG